MEDFEEDFLMEAIGSGTASKNLLVLMKQTIFLLNCRILRAHVRILSEAVESGRTVGQRQARLRLLDRLRRQVWMIQGLKSPI